MTKKPAQRPEGRLIEQARVRSGESARKAAGRIGISDTRLRHIINGYQPVGRGQYVDAVAPAETLARIAIALGISADELEQAGRADAAAEVRSDTLEGHPFLRPASPDESDRTSRYALARGEMRAWLDEEVPEEERDFAPPQFLVFFQTDHLLQEIADRLHRLQERHGLAHVPSGRLVVKYDASEPSRKWYRDNVRREPVSTIDEAMDRRRREEDQPDPELMAAHRVDEPTDAEKLDAHLGEDGEGSQIVGGDLHD